MRTVIRSRDGEAWVFTRPSGFYIYLDTSGTRPGTLGQQITERGGHTIGYEGDDPAEFARICRAWYRSHKRAVARAMRG